MESNMPDELTNDQVEESTDYVDQGEFMVPDEPIDTDGDGAEEPETEAETDTDDDSSNAEDSDVDDDSQEKDTDKPETKEPTELEKAQAALAQATKEKNWAAAELRKSRKPVQTESPLTDAQLEAIISEHKDDPASMLKIMKYVSDESTKKGNADTIDAMKVSEVKSKTDQYVKDNWDVLLDESSPTYTEAQNLKNTLGVKDHFAADYLIGSVMVAQNYQKDVEAGYQKGLAEGQGKLTEANRKKGIKDGKLESSSPKTKQKVATKSEWESNANILELKGSARTEYFKMMAGGTNEK